jgi:hypothetical protein
MGAALLNPVSSARKAPYAGSRFTVTATVAKKQTWRLDVLRASDRSVVRTLTGVTSAALTAPVDLKDRAGGWLPPGGYTLSLTSAAGGDAAVAWSAPFDVTATSTSPPATSPGPPATAGFVPVSPARVLDTRTGLGSDMGQGVIPAQGRIEVKVLGVGGVPASGVAGVAVNLTGVGHGGATYLTGYPAEGPWPTTSSVNLAPNQAHATLLTLGVGPAGRISVYNSAATADAVVDVVGYFPTSGGSTYEALSPSRLIDTRVTSTPFHNGEVRPVQIAGVAGVPADATAVVANVTATHTGSAGLLSVFPAGGTRPSTSTLNFDAGEVASNRVVVGLSGGKLSVYTQATRTDVLIDVVGSFRPHATGALFTPLAPARLLDTRSAVGVKTRTPAASGSTTVLSVTGRGGVPAGAKAVVMTVTTTGTTSNGFVTGWSGDATRPEVSDVNSWTGHTVSNLGVFQLSKTGTISLYDGGGSSHLIGDVVGFFR